jgi:CHAD domain-containing protein
LLNALRQFVLVDEAGASSDGFPRIDDPKFRVAAGRTTRTLKRTWLDTFDWRLFRAGLTLELTTGRGSSEFVLTGRDDELVAVEPAEPDGAAGAAARGRIRLPCLIDALPLGPLRERLAPVVGIRALLPVTRATSALTERRAVNADDKTVAVLTVDRMAVTQPRTASTPARIAISPLRGYQAQTAKLAELLAAAPGVRLADHSSFESALAAAGRKAGDYSSKIDVQLTGAMPAALSLALVLGRLFDGVAANVPGTVRDIDTEFLHDLRVAVRRTRSVLKMAGPALPAGLISRYQPEFKWLGDLTTPTRDLDVYLLGYSSMAAQLLAATELELRPFHDYLQRQRALAQRQLVRGLRSARFASLADRWRQDLEQVTTSPGRRPTTGAFAARRIAKAHQRVLQGGGGIEATSPPEALHELRKRCKELRYALEIFASLHNPAEQWRAVNELKALQDCLGEFQDTEVQHNELRSFAARMMADRSAPAQTLLAMGEIAATLAVRQHKARNEFAGRFADFASPAGRARISALTQAAT